MLALYDTRIEALRGAGVVRERAGKFRVIPSRPEVAPASSPTMAPARVADRRSVDSCDPLDRALLRALHSLRHAEARVVSVEARLLAWIRDHRAHRELGFSCFGDMVRMFQIAPRTAQEHVLLHRLLEGRPTAADAFRLGELSMHQVLALAPVLNDGDLERSGGVDWIEIAGRLTVAQLRRRVRETMSSRARDAADFAAPRTLDPASTSALEDPAGSLISFHAPLAAALEWDRNIDQGRAMLGRDAPTYLCVDAILAEASPQTAGAPKPCLEPTEENRGTPDPSAAALARVERKTSARFASESIPHATTKARRRAGCALDLVLKTLQGLTNLEDAVDPASPREAALRLRDLQKRSRSLRALFARLLRDLRETGSLWRMGYSGFDELAWELGLSERAARELRRQADVFEDYPAIEAAFAAGRIGSEQAGLVARVASRRTVKAYVERAVVLTTRQLVREIRFGARLHDFDPQLAAAYQGPLPNPRLERGLMDELVALGWSEAAIEQEFKRLKLIQPAGEAPWTGNLLDPACNPIIMRRLELLFELLVSSSADAARIRSMPSGNEMTSARDPNTSDLADSAGDRKTSARGDADGTRSRREKARSRIRFWAPQDIADHWRSAIEAVRSEYAVRVPGPPSRIEPLPTWAAALLLCDQAASVWKLQDPETIPTEWRVLERDEYRCRISACSCRQNLQVHHARYRSRRGSNRMFNKSAVCIVHHREIHDGYVRFYGEAPHRLIVELGCQNGLPPLFVFHGEKLLQRE